MRKPRECFCAVLREMFLTRRFVFAGILFAALLLRLHHLEGATVTVGELTERRNWVAARFEGRQPSPRTDPALVVFANHGPVIKNARAAKPLRIAGQDFKHGLLAHAPSKVLVRLPGPGDTFTALVGIDSNEQTSGGRGSVDFSVQVGGAEKFRSGVLREGMAGKAIKVDLGGATEFVIQGDETADGIGWDHADWVEAKVTLQDGRELWLDELPVQDAAAERYATEPPFSFVYGGKSSSELLTQWKLERSSRSLDAQRTERTLAWTDPQTGLQVRCVAVEYADFPTIEWTLHFKNPGTNDTPILSDIQALDASFARSADGEFTLHYNKGDTCAIDSYEPLTEVLAPSAVKRFAPAGGRPTNLQFPFWNVARPGGGFLAVIGWPGQWSARFERDVDKALRIRAGQELTHFILHPGEEVRSPLVALQFYKGDWLRAQNVWRRWMVVHNLPRPGGRLVPTHYGACWSVDLHPSAAPEMAVLNGYVREKIPLEFYFIDAGWYPGRGNWWETTGTWEVAKERFPKGIREVSDHARANGMQFVLWFEPERAAAGTWLAENHPEWILGGKQGGLVNLGNPDAWKWVVERVDSLIVSEGVDVYRQDFNIDPLGYWRGNDLPDRQGITEIRHVTGYLAFWDELLRRHPRLWLDSCASGGRRNDLETLRRSVPLLRSDAFGTPAIQQCHTYGLSLWFPYHGSGLGESDPYWFRSCIFPASRVGWDTRKPDLDYALLRRMVAEFHQVQPYLLGDYYPLTAYSQQEDTWVAWQYDQPEEGEGLVQVFRREDSPYEVARFKLRGLDPATRYSVTDLDKPEAVQQFGGRELTERGLPITLPAPRSAGLLTYQRLNAAK
jgi:alpha-galactosidase